MTREEIKEKLAPVCRTGVCVAVSGLFSTRNPELEQEAAEIAAELGAKVICGKDVAPGQLNYLRRMWFKHICTKCYKQQILCLQCIYAGI